MPVSEEIISLTKSSIFIFEGGKESQGVSPAPAPGAAPAPLAWRKHETKSQNPPQLPGLKAAFSNSNYLRYFSYNDIFLRVVSQYKMFPLKGPQLRRGRSMCSPITEVLSYD